MGLTKEKADAAKRGKVMRARGSRQKMDKLQKLQPIHSRDSVRTKKGARARTGKLKTVTKHWFSKTTERKEQGVHSSRKKKGKKLCNRRGEVDGRSKKKRQRQTKQHKR